MVPYNSLNRIHGWINCEKHMKKNNKSERKKRQINVRPRKVKVSIHSHENQCKWHTGRYEKCVNLTNNHPRETPPIKNQCRLRNTTSHVVRIPWVNRSSTVSWIPLALETHLFKLFTQRERQREKRLPEWNTNQQVDIEGFLHLYSPVLFLFTITS